MKWNNEIIIHDISQNYELVLIQFYAFKLKKKGKIIILGIRNIWNYNTIYYCTESLQEKCVYNFLDKSRHTHA